MYYTHCLRQLDRRTQYLICNPQRAEANSGHGWRYSRGLRMVVYLPNYLSTWRPLLQETFEIGAMEYSCDLMLPYWRIIKHKAKGFAAGGIICFESEECKATCTRHNCISFPIEIDDTILDFGNDPGWIAIFGSPNMNDTDEREID